MCLPDFQGLGIGHAVAEFVASLYAASGKPYTSTTSHPSMIPASGTQPAVADDAGTESGGAGREPCDGGDDADVEFCPVDCGFSICRSSAST